MAWPDRGWPCRRSAQPCTAGTEVRDRHGLSYSAAFKIQRNAVEHFYHLNISDPGVVIIRASYLPSVWEDNPRGSAGVLTRTDPLCFTTQLVRIDCYFDLTMKAFVVGKSDYYCPSE